MSIIENEFHKNKKNPKKLIRDHFGTPFDALLRLGLFSPTELFHSVHQVYQRPIYFRQLKPAMRDFNYLEPAQVKVLVVPIGDIGPIFDKHLTAFQTATNIRLVDVSPIPLSKFNPQQNSQGRVLLQFTTRYSENETAFLGDFEPFRRTLVVLGLGLYTDYSPHITADLKQKYPAAITHNCVFFHSSKDQKAVKDNFFVTEEAERIITSIETILCDVTYNFLVNLNGYASGYENITLSSPVSSIDGNVLTRTIQQAQKKISASSNVSYSNGQSVSPNKKDHKIKSLQKQSGRQAKIMANFYLLAGCTVEAVQYFTDAAINTRKSEDYLWLASALEGLSVALLILHYLGHPIPATNPMLYGAIQIPKTKTFQLGTTTNRSSSESITSRQSGAIMSPRSSMASNISTSGIGAAISGMTELSKLQPQEFLLLLCLRSSHFYHLSTTEIEDCVPDIVYVESLLRSIDFMQIAYLNGSDGVSHIVRSMLEATDTINQADGQSSVVSKETIVHEIHRIFSLELNKLGSNQKFRVYSKIAIVYENLGFRRRKGFVLRQHLRALQSQLNKLTKLAQLPDEQSKTAINDILDQILCIYDNFDDDSQANLFGLGWPSLESQILTDCLDIAKSLQDNEMAAKMCITLLHRYAHCLNAESQKDLNRKLNLFLQHLDDEKTKSNVAYPDPYLIRTVTFKNDAEESLSPFPATSTNRADEVVFNPFSKKIASGIDMTKVICVKDTHPIIISFQNPYFFDVCILSIAAVTKDDLPVEIHRDNARVVGSEHINDLGHKIAISKESSAAINDSQIFEKGGSRDSLKISARSVTAVEFQMTPLETGDLIIEKFLVGVDQLSPQPFSIVSKELYPFSCKIKFRKQGPPLQGLHRLDKLINRLAEGIRGIRLEPKLFQLTVIPAQPQLTLIESLISNGWLMLLEGEKQHCHIKLFNSSSETVNYLSFSFWDTSLDAISSVLSSKDNKLGAEDIHELEWQLLKKKAATITNKEQISDKYSNIEAGEEMNIEFDVFGKRAVKEMRLNLEYALKNEVDLTKGFIKTMHVPFKVSVHRSVEVISCEVMPLLPTSIQDLPSSSTNENRTNKHIQDLLEFLSQLKDRGNDAKKFCLLALDLRNYWREKLCVNIRFKVTSDKELTINEIIDLEHTSRFLIPVRRSEHGMEHYFKPIPSLQKKQFIKNTEISEEQQAQERLSYWLRSALLENLSGEWKSVGCELERAGEIDMRRIRLTPSLIAALIQDSILLHHEIVSDDDATMITKSTDDCYDLECSRFYTISTLITNNSSSPIYGVLRYIPFPVHARTKQDLSIEKKILYNGVLQRNTGAKAIEPGSSITMKLGFLVLEKGLYEWGSVFDQGTKESGIVDREPLYIRAK